MIILAVWIACATFSIRGWAKEFGEITLFGAIFFILFAPATAIAEAIMGNYLKLNPILWKRKK